MNMTDQAPAFPSSTAEGMTLRDYFAAQALPECIRVADGQMPGPSPNLSELFAKASKFAYFAADEMLKTRRWPVGTWPKETPSR